MVPGVLALLFVAAHAGDHLLHGHPEELLWSCTVAPLWIGAGHLRRSGVLNAIGTMWLCFGVPLWILYLAGGGACLPTTWLTHVGGLALGGWGVRRLGLPRGSWWKAALGMIALLALTRLVTPARANVNLVFAVHDGWERWFPDHRVYLLVLTATASAIFFAAGRGLRKLARSSSPEVPCGSS